MAVLNYLSGYPLVNLLCAIEHGPLIVDLLYEKSEFSIEKWEDPQITMAFRTKAWSNDQIIMEVSPSENTFIDR